MVFQQNLLEKAYFLPKHLVCIWSGRPVLTSGKRPKSYGQCVLFGKGEIPYNFPSALIICYSVHLYHPSTASIRSFFSEIHVVKRA